MLQLMFAMGVQINTRNRSIVTFSRTFSSVRVVVLACLPLLFATSLARTCPSDHDVIPCKCSDIKGGVSLECNGSGGSERIASVIRDIESSLNLELTLESLAMPVLPDSIRKASSLRLHDVHVEKMSNNHSVAWSRLNDMVIESSTITEQPWPRLEEAKSLKHLKVSNMTIPTIGSQFKAGLPDGIAYLDIRRTQTTAIHSFSLSRLTKLKYFLMVDVPLQKFPRDSLPQELPYLHTFILGNTQIEELETGFFKGMPKLEVLMLNGNRFKTLDSYLFAPVDKHLTHLLAERNPLICDCNIIWLTKNMHQKGSIKVLATCTDSNTEERKEVTMLDENEYCT